MTIYEAIQRVRLGEVVWVTFEGERLELGPPTTADWSGVRRFLCRWRCSGGVALADGWTKDAGDRVRLVHGGRVRVAPWRDVLAEVLESHPRERAA
jgi:hypothetical protein